MDEVASNPGDCGAWEVLTIMDQSFLVELGKSGPWAAVAGFLLWQVIRAWDRDRNQVTELLRDFSTTLDGLKHEIHNLAETQNRLVAHLTGDKVGR